ncbi:MAG TPA: allantoinase AllB [Vicinamibacterales bacterium]
MIIRGRRVVLPEGVRPAAIHIDQGRIVRISEDDEASGDDEVYDAGALVVSPGIVDTHVHVNEPGRTEWEGFDTATRAAAAGGVTTIVDMPLNSIPATTTLAALGAKRTAASGQCHVDVAFWGGVVPGNGGSIDALVDSGVRGFKCFLVPSGVDEFPYVDEETLRRVLPTIARRGVPLLVHAELPDYIAHLPHQTYPAYLATRPPRAEVEAVRLMIRLAAEHDAHVHIVHVACAEAVEEIMRAKAAGTRITAETCPHYLTFTSDEIAEGATEFKCAPPIREPCHGDALWRGLETGALDLIVTDHSPAPPVLKTGDFASAWGGIASLELSLAAVWTALSRRRATRNGESDDVAIERISRWMSENPARLAGLAATKGRIAVGADADLCAWDPDAELVVDPRRLQQRHKLTPYAGRRLRGVVRATFVRGRRVWDGDQHVGEPIGQLL